VYVDSIEYRDVALFGGNRRPWTVPLLYNIVGDAQLRVFAHAVLGAFAWGALALALASALQHRVVQLVATGVVVATSLTTAVTNYDATITSESVAVSLTVLLLALLLRLVLTREPTMQDVAGLLVVIVLFAFTRNDHPLVLWAMVVPMAVVAIRMRERAWAVIAVGLVVVAGWSWYASTRNDEIQRFNLAMIMANRVVADAGMFEWFVDRGMPVPAGVEPVVGLAGGDTTLAFANDARWNRWASDDGTGAYGRYLLTHPRYLLLEPWPDVLGLRNTTLEPPSTTPVLLAPTQAYGRVHPVIPEAVESLVWGQREAGAAAVALVVLGGHAMLRARRLRGRGRTALLAALGPVRTLAAAGLVIAAGHLLLVWHASPIELDRLAMVPATTVHACLIILLAVTADRVLECQDDGIRGSDT
jgi:hypothetical protein